MRQALIRIRYSLHIDRYDSLLLQRHCPHNSWCNPFLKIVGVETFALARRSPLSLSGLLSGAHRRREERRRHGGHGSFPAHERPPRANFLLSQTPAKLSQRSKGGFIPWTRPGNEPTSPSTRSTRSTTSTHASRSRRAHNEPAHRAPLACQQTGPTHTGMVYTH